MLVYQRVYYHYVALAFHVFIFYVLQVTGFGFILRFLEMDSKLCDTKQNGSRVASSTVTSKKREVQLSLLPVGFHLSFRCFETMDLKLQLNPGRFLRCGFVSLTLLKSSSFWDAELIRIMVTTAGRYSSSILRTHYICLDIQDPPVKCLVV